MRQKTNHLGHMKVTKICAINTDKEAIVFRFIKLFSGLGCLTEENQIKLLLMQQVKKELKRMEKEGVITKVEGRTNW